jgi:hypothetical protein
VVTEALDTLTHRARRAQQRTHRALAVEEIAPGRAHAAPHPPISRHLASERGGGGAGVSAHGRGRHLLHDQLQAAVVGAAGSSGGGQAVAG